MMFTRELVIGIVIGAVLFYAVWKFKPGLIPGGGGQ